MATYAAKSDGNSVRCAYGVGEKIRYGLGASMVQVLAWFKPTWPNLTVNKIRTQYNDRSCTYVVNFGMNLLIVDNEFGSQNCGKYL